MSYNEELLDIAPAIRAIAEPFPVKNHHWISTPDGDLGSEWCGDCGYYMVRHLRRRDKKQRRDYLLDGGWRTESDHTCWCAGCGMRLDCCLTDYGANEELAHYRTYGIQSFCAEIAYDLADLVDHYDYEHDKTNPRDTADVINLARNFIAGHHYQEVIQLSQWADDGGRA